MDCGLFEEGSRLGAETHVDGRVPIDTDQDPAYARTFDVTSER
jgi:hypothetical protein